MAAPTIVLVETAIIGVLREISDLTVASYMGQMDDAGRGDAVTFPAAFPLYGGEKLEYVDGPNYRRVQEWNIVIGAQSYGGAADPLTRAQVGAYAVVEAVLDKMANWTDVDLTGIESATPKSVSRVRLNRTEAWYLVSFSLAFDQAFTWQGDIMTSGTLTGYKVSVTDANTTKTFPTTGGPTTGITIYNAGANSIFVAVNAVATNASVEIPAGTTITLAEFSATSIGVICAAGLASTAYIYVTGR